MLISELWDWKYGMLMVNNDGEALWTYDALTNRTLPTHVRFIEWHSDGREEFVFFRADGTLMFLGAK